MLSQLAQVLPQLGRVGARDPGRRLTGALRQGGLAALAAPQRVLLACELEQWRAIALLDFGERGENARELRHGLVQALEYQRARDAKVNDAVVGPVLHGQRRAFEAVEDGVQPRADKRAGLLMQRARRRRGARVEHRGEVPVCVDQVVAPRARVVVLRVDHT